MNEVWIWWIVQFILSSLDFVIMYFLSHTLMKKYMIVKVQHILLGIVCTVIMSLVFNFLDGFTARIINHLLFLIMIKLIIRRSDLGDLLVINTLSFMIMGLIQTPIAGITWLIAQLLGLGESTFLIIGQTLTVVAVIPVSKKIKWYKLYYAIHVNVVSKLVLFIFAFVILTLMSIFNFERNALYLIFSILVLLLVGLALFPVIIKLYKNTVDILSVHDLKNELLSTAFAIKDMDDIDAVKEMYSELAGEFGVNVSKLDAQKSEDAGAYMDRMGVNIKEFICLILENHKSRVKIISDIVYYEPNETVKYKTALKWLGTLLDNAIEASDKNPIYVTLFSMDDDFTLKVANEYMGEKGTDIKNIFEKGYTTKNDGQGVGLHNLYTKAIELGGDVKVDEYYTKTHNCHYLQIDIIIE